MREFIFTDEHSVAFAKALVSNRGSKFGLPTEAALPAKVGGARRNRTDDLLLAKQALSQLSYGPFRGSITEVGIQKARGALSSPLIILPPDY